MFQVGTVYKRSEIHDKYGGNRQSGIAPSANYPYIFIFSGAGGKQHGYKDQWENENMFSYTGEGQVGDMQYTKGNLQLRDHLAHGKRVFLFEYVAKGYVKYITELEFYDSDYFETHDRTGKLRLGIKFFFKRKGAELYVTPDQLEPAKSLAMDKKMIYDMLEPNTTERKGLVTSRVGQGAYRKSIMHRWEYQCAVTGFGNPKVLVASHIVPWKEATDDERLDVANGILLSPTYDALFDRHLISFDHQGKILMGKEIQQYSLNKLGVDGTEIIHNLNDSNQEYLERHRSNLI